MAPFQPKNDGRRAPKPLVINPWHRACDTLAMWQTTGHALHDFFFANSRTCLACQGFTKTKSGRHTGPQPGTKSGRRPAGKPHINRYFQLRVNRMFCSPSGLNGNSFVRASEEMFKQWERSLARRLQLEAAAPTAGQNRTSRIFLCGTPHSASTNSGSFHTARSPKNRKQPSDDAGGAKRGGASGAGRAGRGRADRAG